LSDPGRSPSHAPAPVDAERLAELAAGGDNEFIRALLGYLAKPDDAGRALFRHDALRRRTRTTIGRLLIMADQHDTKKHPEPVREQWRGVRNAARAEREALSNLPPEGAGPRRRALERMGQEYPAELAELRATAASKKMRRSLLEKIAKRYPVRMIEILREERKRGDESV
jgi:hypothetical protein